MKKNIAFLIYDDSLMGGAEKISLQIASELTKYHNVHVFSIFNENKISHNKYSQDIVHHVLCEKTVSITKNLIRLSRLLRSKLVKSKIDVLFCITAGVNGLGIIATRGLKIKTVYCEHSNLKNQTYGKKHYIRQKYGAMYMNYVVTLTEKDKENFIKEFNLDRNKVTVIYNWFDIPEDFIDVPYNIKSKTLITAGRLAKVKGYDMLIEVAKIVFYKYPDWKWDIYGDGEMYDEIHEKIISLGLENNIILKGKSNNMINDYKNHAMYVLTSRYEGLPLSLLEAKVNHLPIVSFDCDTGPNEIVRDEVDGFLVESCNTKEMVEKIESLISNSEIRKKMSDLSCENLNKFKKDIIINQWLKLVDSL